MTSDDLPIGRRVARWRVRRSMTQQMLADRLRRSKSWVDKVERGVRSLDRYSVIQELAHVLRVDPEVLLGQPCSTPTGPLDGVDDIRAALARYDIPQGPSQTDELRRQVGYAWLSYQHAHYGQLVRVLPGLLDAAQAVQTRSFWCRRTGSPRRCWSSSARPTSPGSPPTARCPPPPTTRSSRQQQLSR
ncbi:helix-turn-helix domain-containing protein [Micromonospora sp. NBC_01638]|uniref:helix-turn-helix domain-containing protein n=1 Tax=Micromonospora sp. NBC_01638 TaxID=2975982 RepID=UPI00386BD02D|nr:helix-turn-helix domain-containing protein [Micromonospora sp. NBC_01638]